MKVLAVDDDALALIAMRGMVTGLGYECLGAHNGAEAWELIQAEAPDMVITDRVMPDIDGLELCRKIRLTSTGPDYIYIVLASGLGQDEQARDGMLAGADDYLTKPVRLGQLELKLIAAKRVTSLHHQLAEASHALGKSENQLSILNFDLELRVQERTAALETSSNELAAFAYSVSHDLRAPLRSIHGYSQILLDEYSAALAGDGIAHLGRVQANATRMGQIIDDLLSLSRTTRAELRRREIDLSRLVGTIHQELVEQNPGRDVKLSVPDNLKTTGDARLIRLALSNLMSNAWKFTANQTQPEVTIGSFPQDLSTVFFIRDNGAGFDPRFAKKLFEPFQRLHPAGDFEGTGIGLAIVHRVIRRHDGEIWAESSPDRGATFFFTTTAKPAQADLADHDEV